MAEQLSAGFEQHSQNLKDRVAFLKRMAKEEEDRQIHMRWEAEQEKAGGRKPKREKAEAGQGDPRRERRRRCGWRPSRGARTARLASSPLVKKLPEPPETLEAAERLTQEAVAAVMRGDKCPDRADKRRREVEDAERRVHGHAVEVVREAYWRRIPWRRPSR